MENSYIKIIEYQNKMTMCYNTDIFSNDQINRINKLLKQGLDVDKIVHYALMCVCRNGYIGKISFFLQKRYASSINEGLVLACQNGHIDIARILLLNGADPRYNDHSALKIAFKNGHILVGRLLMLNGASLSTYNECLYAFGSIKN